MSIQENEKNTFLACFIIYDHELYSTHAQTQNSLW